eukprot:TRINITY_DN61717_c0_g1_i1.p1 TRINITY_DN61717_c0_g1~~TRINITY_DN61717_c0_g1_i1.p1  ORF type:complete len:685 (+),score=140.51 TRINITY_DN61717_c0_g1_i1:121-2175(+)
MADGMMSHHPKQQRLGGRRAAFWALSAARVLEISAEASSDVVETLAGDADVARRVSAILQRQGGAGGSADEQRTCDGWTVQAGAVSDEEIFDAVFRSSQPRLVRGAVSDLVGRLARLTGTGAASGSKGSTGTAGSMRGSAASERDADAERPAGSFGTFLRFDLYGNLVAPVDVDTSRQFNRFDKAEEVLLFPASREMTLRNFVDEVERGNGSLALQQVEFDFANELGFELPLFLRWAEPSSDFHHTWLCGANKTSHLHYDNDDGFLVQLTGTKRAYLIDPHHFGEVRPILAPHRFPAGDGGNAIPEGVSALPAWHYASRYPRRLAVECVVKPGDVLLIPALWYHRVETDSVSGLDGLNAAFNWWFFTDRLLRDQLWPWVQRNLFAVSPAWRRLPFSGLFVPQPPPAGLSERRQWWWPEATTPASCARAVWGSFRFEQLIGRFFARSRPGVLTDLGEFPAEMLDAALKLWRSRQVRATRPNGEVLLEQLGQLLEKDGAFSVTGGTAGELPWRELLGAAGEVDGSALWPFGDDLRQLFSVADAGVVEPAVRLARGKHGQAGNEGVHILHWQLRGTTRFHLEAPLDGLRRRAETRRDMESAGEHRGGGMTCEAAAGNVVLVPQRWWLTVEDADEATISLQWRVPGHALALKWWDVISTLVLGENVANPMSFDGDSPGLADEPRRYEM